MRAVVRRELEEMIRTATSGQLAAFIAEPIQGVGGFVIPPEEYLSIAAEGIRKYGGIFISDEIQTGFGWTGGKGFGETHWGIQLDISTDANGLGNGLQIGPPVPFPKSLVY